MTDEQRLEAWSRAFFDRLLEQQADEEADRFAEFAQGAETYFAEQERLKEQKRLRKEHYRMQHRARGY